MAKNDSGQSEGVSPAKKYRKGVGGRPSVYDPVKTPKQAYLLCARHGATDEQLAEIFDVTVTTIHNWKNQHPEFLDALKDGKDAWDTDKVEKALVHRAIGYSHDDVDIRVVNGEIVQTPIKKHYPPDATSMIFWLKNRQKDRWRDKVEHDHGVQEDNPLRSILEGLAGATLRPVDGDE